ncbi:P-loop containing nucleoside triphosphate hydrolase protein [Mycena latifolia]|nr:P-loop containing nucleoside triphosphate hydrolase protein [Mycena latifolia]
MDPFLHNIHLPMSESAVNAFKALPPAFMAGLSPVERHQVLDAFLYLDFASKGTKLPRELQLRAYLAVKAGKDLLVRSGTGSGKTLAMILPVLSMAKNSIVVTISPLRLIQDNHVAEFNKYGIPSIAINCYTPNDPALWKVSGCSIKNHTVFRHYSGHIPHFAKLLHDVKWAKRIELLQIDEAHFIKTAGQAKGKEAVFRPAFSDLGERVRIHLPATTPCTAFSASMPRSIMDILTKTLRMDPAKTIKVELTTNRPNLIHAVTPMINSINNFANLDFLIPSPYPPNFVLPKSMVFFDHKHKAAALARYLNAKLPSPLAKKELFRHYHSGMSKPYLEHIANSFKQPDGDVRCLIATDSASNGFDVPDISLIALFGVPKTLFDVDQRGGRGGRDGRECLVLMIAERWAYDNLAQTDADHEPDAKEERTDSEVVLYANSTACRHRILAKHNNDATPRALHFSGAFCCDNDDPNFDLSNYLIGPLSTEGGDSNNEPPPKRTRKKYRPVAQHQDITDSLLEWRTSVHIKDPVAKNFPPPYILDETSITLLARERPAAFKTPSEITDFLGETADWHSQYALDILTIIRLHDIQPLSSSSSSDSEESEHSSNSESDSNPDEMQLPTEDDQNTALGRTTHSSPSSSRANSPDSEPEPQILLSAAGRPLRRSAANHRVTGIAENMTKKQKL